MNCVIYYTVTSIFQKSGSPFPLRLWFYRSLAFLKGLKTIIMTRSRSSLGIWILSFIMILISCHGSFVTMISNDWKIFHVTTDGTDSYYNSNLIRHFSDDTVQVWTKIFVSDHDRKKMTEHMTREESFNNGWNGWSHNICLIELNCREKKSRWIQVTSYDDHGNVLDSSSSKRKGNWESIVPDSLGDNLLKKVCTTGNRK